ncbi:MAG: type II toxin-antitoxin system VapC family toxin [Geodermatophilaceae bacterium]|nr:type II toxin-antitoxin system VapC family toxin [Geodermatophilaceae bacterium]MDQ3465812.1 type II toxin-antitoxin system VapC family toxin [Actinomycetota bacterium]
MTVVYVDASALLKRVVVEAESQAVRRVLLDHHAEGALLTSSSLAWVEVWRSLRRAAVADVEVTVQVALAGVAEFPLTEAVLTRARRVGPDELRSLDAIHLTSAIAVGADTVFTYDVRLARAAESAGLGVLAPTD